MREPELRRVALGLSLLAASIGTGCAAVGTSEEVNEPVHIGAFAGIDSVNYDQAPMPTVAPPPAYPEFAREAGISGTVVLRVLVNEEGRVEWIDVLQPVTGLTEAADYAVRHWVFNPALRDGQPVSAAIKVPITFHIETPHE